MIDVQFIIDRINSKCNVFVDVHSFFTFATLEDIMDYPIAVVYASSEEVLPNDVITNITQRYSNTYHVDIAAITPEQLENSRNQVKDALIGWQFDQSNLYSAFEFNGGNLTDMNGEVMQWQDNYITRSWVTYQKVT